MRFHCFNWIYLERKREVGKQVCEQVCEQVGEQVCEQECEQLGEQVCEQVGEQEVVRDLSPFHIMNRNFVPENIMAACIQKTSTRKIMTPSLDSDQENSTSDAFGKQQLIRSSSSSLGGLVEKGTLPVDPVS